MAPARIRDQCLCLGRGKEEKEDLVMEKQEVREKWFIRLLVAVEIIWIALLAFAIVAMIQVITARADEPKQIINGEYVIAEIRTQDNAIDISEAPPINDLSSVLDALDATQTASTVYGGISLSEEDFDLLRRIMALEGHTEGHEGLKAIAEVVFNRMRSDRFPDTLQGVIYQRGQFATVKYLSKPYVLPGEAEDDAISEVLRETETVLPSTEYVFFSRGKSNGKAFVKINHHWFSR